MFIGSVSNKNTNKTSNTIKIKFTTLLRLIGEKNEEYVCDGTIQYDTAL